MTSPVSELLVQESLCTDLFKTISESVDATRHVDSDVSSAGQDDVIGKLLDKMIQILPPEERNIFGTTDDKNIEEIIEEANELIRATTPLFSSTDSGDQSNKTSKALSKISKANETSKKNDSIEEDVTPKKSESGTSSLCSSLESIIVKDSLSHELADKVKGNQMPGSGSSEKLDKDIEELFYMEESNKNLFEKQLGAKEMASARNDEDVLLGEFSKREVNETNMNIRAVSMIKVKDKQQPNSDNNVIESVPSSTFQEKLENCKQVPLHISPKHNKDPDAQLEALRQQYTTEIQELKLTHNKEIYGLTKQITSLNDKIFELQKQSQIVQSPDLKIQEIERLENEIKCQEQLLAGYERENKKLCKEISNLKEGWKQRENKLVEEKQRLQNQLQGMVSNNLHEQLKDARETIVKLQIEVTSYKSKNKELESVNERIRVEMQSLQQELNNCRCDRSAGGRRDKHSASVGSQMLEMKNIIARKDIEIAQMNTTLRILKGELSNREVTMPMNFGPVGSSLEDQSQLELTVSQLQTSLAVERQNYRDLAKEKDVLHKENLDLKRQVRELESIVKRRQRSESCFPVTIPDPTSTSRLAHLEKELSNRQESLTTLHSQFIKMQKKYEDHIQELENRLKESRDEIQTVKANWKKEEASQKLTARKMKQAQPVKEETHLLATIRGLRQEVATKEKEMNKLNKEMEELRQTNRKLQKEREKQLNAMPSKMGLLRDKPNLKKMEKVNTITGSRNTLTSPNNNIDPILYAELQESNLILKSKTKSLQEEVKRLEQDLIAMHNKRVHDIG
ncbi:centrosomal protein of 162 kDa-like isoform X2 [Macrosteles quadrilineatus]|uniref:centrosomal protein of 162 kDa-like isoform X2 n=1 Tax=Macrosteles quadrilineatus TaxID=74068 RepID=UPI0023E0B4F0|nr:centrosomal protein of 162 kDa-like isoform X2 [Macrosteles quadrilineatus]